MAGVEHRIGALAVVPPVVAQQCAELRRFFRTGVGSPLVAAFEAFALNNHGERLAAPQHECWREKRVVPHSWWRAASRVRCVYLVINSKLMYLTICISVMIAQKT